MNTNEYQAYKDNDNNSMQDINNKGERVSNRKHKGFVCSSTLALHPRLRHYEGFPLELIPPDHSLVPQHLQALRLPSLYTPQAH